MTPYPTDFPEAEAHLLAEAFLGKDVPADHVLAAAWTVQGYVTQQIWPVGGMKEARLARLALPWPPPPPWPWPTPGPNPYHPHAAQTPSARNTLHHIAVLAGAAQGSTAMDWSAILQWVLTIIMSLVQVLPTPTPVPPVPPVPPRMRAPEEVLERSQEE